MSEVAANELGKGVNLSDLCARSIEDEPTANFLGRRRQRKRQSHSIIQHSENDDFDSDSLSPPPNVSMFSSSDSVPFETNKTSAELCNEEDEERPTKLANLKENPEIHSFRIVNAEAAAADQDTEDALKETSSASLDKDDEKKSSSNTHYSSSTNNNNSNNNNNSSSSSSGKERELNDTDVSAGGGGGKSQKYVLMCFICKLSFGETKSFFQHAKFEHKICDLKWKKEFANVDLEGSPQLSAIIQKDSNDTPSVCFLEPMSTNYNYETLLKGTKIELPGRQSSGGGGGNGNGGGATGEDSGDQPKHDLPDLSSFFKEEALKHRKLSEALQSVVANSEAVAAAAAAAAADEKNMLASGGGGNSNLNAYLFELCRQIYGGAAAAGGGLPPMMMGNQNHNSSKTEQQQQQHQHSNNSHHHHHHQSVDDKTPNSGRATPDPSEMCEVKIKEERDSLTPIKFESPEMNKSPMSIKADRSGGSENGYGMDERGAMNDMEQDAMTSNLMAMYQTMAAAKRQQQQQQQQQQQSLPKENFDSQMSTLFCPEHKFAGNGQIAPDCKNCAIVNLIKSSMKSPPPPSLQQQQNSTSTKVSPNSSFTIGMCPDHLNGRPIGVECMRCEMILNSSRMSGHSAVTSSTRNSCKTLKCPQCNWHYKYQETLEIHMREKHPDGESACAFCLAGQQHPRLARGESYTCGYKPYRCEICNYSTTTKGNLSIHMQSDKHLNNMQELSNQQQQQQQIVDVDPLPMPLSKTPQKSPPHMSTGGGGGGGVGGGSSAAVSVGDLSALTGSGQSTMMNKMCNTMKPNFRCDVCSYETAVARNLRIHMTSEKHIQNMTALQQNIKQYQFMKQAPPASIMQQLQSCLPEQAIADYSYNQALLIKLLQHQNQMGGDSGLSTPQPDGAGDESAMDDEEMAKSEGTSGGNTSIDAELAAQAEGNVRSTDSNNNAENKDVAGHRRTPDSQNWFDNDETRGSDCSSNDQYSAENRYSDPQRPYKCDVCQESFTQKSILLVHFNSVSHINRIKKQLPGKSGDEASSLKRKMSDSEQQDSPKKRFKCDICKVAYAQGSTLDIHMRSVLHQTRTCRMNQEQQLRAMQNNSEPKDRPSSTGPVGGDASAQIYKSLLENFGFDLVKQFNEIDPKMGPQNALSQMYKAGLLGSEEALNNKPLSLVPEKNLLAQETANEAMDCSQEGKLFCRYCNKSFSSLFVLKAHYEDMHNDTMPMSMLEKNFFKSSGAVFPDDQVIDFSNKPSKDERAELISPKRALPPTTPEAPPMVPPGPSFEEQQMLQKHLQTMNMLSLMNQNSRVNGDELQAPPPAAAANSFDLLNLLQFHQHLLSLNFMNLAPPLMINNNVQQAQQSAGMSRPGMRPDSVMEEPLIPPSAYGNAFMAAQNNVPPTSQKRARTRITDDQLKILRSHFDINNSPSEESIMEMSNRAKLPMKVVKHWFRNTLFKERQKNKDSPYNFNNPPSTTLNLEEYERTGQAKTAAPQKDAEQGLMAAAQQEKLQQQQQLEVSNRHGNEEKNQDMDKFSSIDEKSQQSNKSFYNPAMNDNEMDSAAAAAGANNIFAVAAALNVALKSSQQRNKSEMSAMSPGTNVSSMCNVDTKSECESITSGCSDLINSANTNGSSQPHSPNDFWSQTPSPIFQQNAAMDMVSGKKFKSDMNAGPSSNGGGSMNGNSSSLGSSGKRANRTRFTDYQIKVLQEFFENNSYPKDSDLEYLSKLLLLSPRVIVVWFQNARQKQRKIYENQPNNMPSIGMGSGGSGGGGSNSGGGGGGGGGSPTPTPTGHGASPMDSPTSSVYSNDGADDKQKHMSGSNISYTCKKCSSVFQRYYELIRHQKNHCFKEENNKKSAKAQIAAAQIAQQCLTTSNPVAMSPSPSSAAVVAAAAAAAAAAGELDLSKSPKSVFPGGAAPSQQHLAAIMAAAAMAVQANEGSGSMPTALDAVDKEEHMDMVRNLTAILGSVANNQNNDCPPFATTKGGGGGGGSSGIGAPQEQYNLSAELRPDAASSSEPSSHAKLADNQMCNKSSLDESYSNASESTTGGGGGGGGGIRDGDDDDDEDDDDDALIQNPSTQQQPPCSTTTTAATTAAGLLFIEDELHHHHQLHHQMDTSSNQHLPTIKLQTEQCNSNLLPTQQPQSLPPSALSSTSSSNGATKRLRTTITPEQLHFLYECYQQESNPSRKMLEQIAKQVNLKKRVVQVWYQNSRARERKGQYRTTNSTTAAGSNIMTSTGNLMAMMDGFGGVQSGNSSAGDDHLKSPKLGDNSPTAADLGFLFNTFKQHY